MGGAKVFPFGGKLRVRRQQRQKRGGEGIGPAGRFCADDPVGGDFNQADFRGGVVGGLAQQIIEDGGIGIQPCRSQFFGLFQALFNREAVFFGCFHGDHAQASFFQVDSQVS